jgi:hypothetical protein
MDDSSLYFYYSPKTWFINRSELRRDLPDQIFQSVAQLYFLHTT